MYNVYLYMNVHMYACMYICMYVCMYVCILLSCRGFRGLISGFEIFVFFYGERSSASRPTPNLEDQGISFSLDHPFDLSGLGDPTSSYATAGIALSVI
jgi:hypothetical protein